MPFPSTLAHSLPPAKTCQETAPDPPRGIQEHSNELPNTPKLPHALWITYMFAYTAFLLSQRGRRPTGPPRRPQDSPGGSQERPKTAQESAKTAQESPKRAQESPKMAPNVAQEREAREQESPREPKYAPQSGPRARYLCILAFRQCGLPICTTPAIRVPGGKLCPMCFTSARCCRRHWRQCCGSHHSPPGP